MNGVNNAGRIGFYPRGNYSNSATYNFLDFVYYGGASYVAKKETTGNTPAENNEYWQILTRGDNNDVVVGDETVEFVEATTRANISSGEALKTILGKIRKWYTDFKTVAFTGSYNDLINKPTIPSVGNGTLTIQKNGSNVKTFTANQSSNVTANITVPTSAADVGAVATSKVLTTKEQINANTDTTNIAGATAVKAMVSEINGNLAVENGRNVLVSATCIGGTTQTYTISGDSITNYRNLLFMLLTGQQILASNVLDKNLFVSGFWQRIFWYDLSYLYYIDVGYISNTQVQIHATYPSSAALGLSIVGFN